MDSESYVHRIGRTGRAGRAGRALLFVENRERRLLRNIERTMKLTIPEVELPNAELLGKRRPEKFAAKVQQQLESSDLDQYRALLAKIQPSAEGEELDVETLVAALLKMAQGERPLILPPDAPMRPKREFRDRDDRFERRGDRNDRGPRGDRPERSGEDRPKRERRDVGDMELYRIEVGRDDGVEVRHIVGAIANEGDISSRYIGNIKLFGSHSTIELPKGMPGEVLQHFTRTRILNKPMNMQLLVMLSRVLSAAANVVAAVSVVKAVVASAAVNVVKVVVSAASVAKAAVVKVVVSAANVVKAAARRAAMMLQLRVAMTPQVVVVSVAMHN